MSPQRVSLTRFFCFYTFLVSGFFTNAQIIAPPPDEVSGGAEGAMHLVNVSPFGSIKDTPETLVSTPSPLFDAVDFDENATNAGFYGIPPDPCGAAGPNHVVNVVNYSIEWHTKAGTQINSQSLKSFFNAATTTFDPKVIYDQYAERFVVVTLENVGRGDLNNANDKSMTYIGVSKTSDPTGGWWIDSINSLVVIGKNTWADYPGFAVDEEAIYVTCNMFTHDSSMNQGVRLWIIPKGEGTGGIYDGGALGENIFDPYTPLPNSIAVTTQPAHTFGLMPAGVGTYLLGYGGLSDGTLEYVQWVRINNPLSMTPTFSFGFVSLGDLESTFPAVPDAPQMGSDSLIDAGDRRALNAVWRGDRIAMCFTHIGSGSNAGEATAHWVLLNDNNGGIPTLVDQGDVGGEDIATDSYTYYPSVALNSNQDLAIGFAASGPNIYAGAYYTGREAADAAGATDAVETLRAGLDWYDRKFGGTRNRWGDYTSTVVDPTDDLSFWVYNEYAKTRGTLISGEDGRWGTTFGKFTVGDCLADQTLAGVIPAGTYTVSNILTATGSINSPSIVFFNAGNEIKLEPEFTVNLGATLEAAISGCP